VWFQCEPQHILRELEEYKRKKYPFDNNTYSQFYDILQYWNFVADATSELHLVANRIFSITITSASIERIFSTMGWLHSACRNRLQVILYQFEFNNTTFYNLHIFSIKRF